jgi:hypothetical protein
MFDCFKIFKTLYKYNNANEKKKHMGLRVWLFGWENCKLIDAMSKSLKQ